MVNSNPLGAVGIFVLVTTKELAAASPGTRSIGFSLQFSRYSLSGVNTSPELQ
jgi:hypothetical protein